MGCGASKPEEVAPAASPAEAPAPAPAPAASDASKQKTDPAAAAPSGSAGTGGAAAAANASASTAVPASGGGADATTSATPKRGTRRGSTANGGKTPGTADPGTAGIVDEVAQKGAAALSRHLAGNMQDEDVVVLTINAMAEVVGGNEKEQDAVHVADGAKEVISALRLYRWRPDVQSAGFRFLAVMAGTYAQALGRMGAVDAVVGGLRSNQGEQQCAVEGVTCLQRLTVKSAAAAAAGSATPEGANENLLRAYANGAAEVIQAVIESNGSDGTLAFRANSILTQLQGLTVEEKVRAESLAARERRAWGMLREAVMAGKAKEIAMGNIPGKHGVSAQVATVMKEGPAALVTFMVERSRSKEVLVWCFDAFATILAGSMEYRAELAGCNGIAKIVWGIKRYAWDERVQANGYKALTAMSTEFSSQIAKEGGVEAVCEGMTNNPDDYQVQTRGTQLLGSLCKNEDCLNRAKSNGAVDLVKGALAKNPEDGQLQWRGIELLKLLEPVQAEEVKQRVVQRSASKAMIRTATKIMSEEGLSREEAEKKAAQEMAALKDVLAGAVIVEEDEGEDSD